MRIHIGFGPSLMCKSRIPQRSLNKITYIARTDCRDWDTQLLSALHAWDIRVTPRINVLFISVPNSSCVITRKLEIYLDFPRFALIRKYVSQQIPNIKCLTSKFAHYSNQRLQFYSPITIWNLNCCSDLNGLQFLDHIWNY